MPIDCFGDHLLECSHGPMKIRRHDSLVDIVHYALFQNHHGVLKARLKEQRAFCEDQSHPGDVYTTQCSCPAFFDLLVLSYQYPAFL